MKKFPTWIIVLIIVAILIASKYIFFPSEKTQEAQTKKKGKGPAVVNYDIVQKKVLDIDIYTTGTIGASNHVELYPEIGGKIISINFNEGEFVEKGRLLFQINDADIQAQLLKSKSLIESSQLKLSRLKKLLEINGISKEEVENLEYEISALKAEQNYLFAQLDKTKITAPFSGIIGLRKISIGAYVAPSVNLASLVQLKPVYVEFSFPEKYSDLFKKGDEVSFTSEQQNIVSKAKIYAIEPIVDELTKTIKARALYDGDRLYYPGSFTKVFLKLKPEEKAILIPTQALLPTMKGQKVFIVKNKLAKETIVKIGVRQEDKIQVLEGLNEGDTLITSGLMSLKNESEVKLIRK